MVELIPRPPRIAEALVWLLTPAHSREPVLGDLAEEFSIRAARATIPDANRWYWAQTLNSAPHLVGMLMRVSLVLTAIVAIAVGYLALIVSLGAIFALFRYFYTINLFQGFIILALSVRLSFEATAFFIAGGFVGFVTWTSNRRRIRDLAIILVLLALIPLWRTICGLFTGTSLMPELYEIGRLFAAPLALGLGAWIGRILARRLESRPRAD